MNSSMSNSQTPITVALVDDHTMFRKGMAHMINDEADMKVVVEASNGVELLDALAVLKSPPDVCILDVNMPKMNGQQTIVQLRKTYPDIKVLILSMIDHEHIIIEMLRQGAGGYMLKEYEPSEMKRAIRIINEEGYYYNSLVSGRMMSWFRKDGKPVEILTDRERDFLKWCVSDLVYKEIADKMNLNLRVVHSIRDQLFDKLRLNTRIGLVLYALRVGIADVNTI